MIVSSFYNKEEKVLILSLGEDSNNKKYKTNFDIEVDEQKVVETVIYNDDKIIGVNLLGYTNDKLSSGIVNNDLVIHIIKKYFDEEISSPYVIGHILEKEKHPKSDKLNICQVDLGEEQVQIVCGAKNVEKGQKVIVSKVGAVMPSGLIIKPSKLLDVPSNGMITSLFELSLNDDKSQGIAVLKNDAKVGTPYYG